MTDWRIVCALVLVVAASFAAPVAADDEASADESAQEQSAPEKLAPEATAEAAVEPADQAAEDVEPVEPDLVEASPPPPEPAPSRRGGISPVMFFVTAGLTAASAGLTIWSVVDMNGDVDAYEEALDRAEETRSLEDLDEAARLLRHGDDKELRTELFLGVTAGMTALTAGLFFLVDWSNGGEGAAPATATVGVSPDGARLLVRGRL